MNRRYLINVLWSWAGVGVTLVSAAIVPRFVVGGIGVVAYGLWTIASSLIEYFWMIDLGFRSATVKLTAEYYAKGDRARVNEVINSGLLYTMTAGGLLALGTFLFAGRVAGFYKADAALQPAFLWLIQVVGISWGLGMMFNIFSAGLEGLQRFDLTGRIWITATIVRAVATVTVVLLGYGLESLGWVMLGVQGLTYSWTFVSFRQAFPDFRFSPAYMTRQMLKEQFRFGLQMMPSIVSGRIMGSVLPTQIARSVSVKAVSYYSLTMKLLEMAAEVIGRVGMVTGPSVTQLMAEGRRSELAELTRSGNRYSLTVWLLPAVFLVIYRWEFYTWWMGAEIAAQCAPLLPPLMLGYTAMTSQFISNALLLGIGRFARYSWGQLVETIFTLSGLAVVLPRWGLLGGAWWIASMLILNRCFYLAWLTQREMEFSMWEYVKSVYSGPVVAGLIGAVCCEGLREKVLPGGSFLSLMAAGLVYAVIYGGLAWVFCLKTEHRLLLQGAVQRKFGLAAV